LLLFLCWTAFPQNSSFPAIGINGAYRLGPGDVLEVKVFEVEELSGAVIVDSRGLIAVPLLPAQCVAGLTTFQIGERLTDLYGRDLLRNPQINVSVREFHSQPVSILGAVENPGIYQLQGERRLLEVLAMAGGFTAGVGATITIFRIPAAQARASEQGERCGELLPDDFAVIHEVPEEIQVSIPLLLTMSRENPIIKPRDVIRVSKAGAVYVVGAVDKPGEFPIKDQGIMTVLRAVSLAAGPSRHSAPQKARIIREIDGTKQEIAAPINDILHGRWPDPVLLAGDILFVPESGTKRALTRGAEAAIQVGTGIAIWRR
jgi:polysaccharide export outer membrane protein